MPDLCIGLHPLMAEQPLLEVSLFHEKSERARLESH